MNSLFVRGNLIKLIAFCLVSCICLTRGVFLIYLAARGLTFAEVAEYQAFYFLFTVLFEVPTGIIGDCLGKKKVLCIGSALAISHSLLMLCIPNVCFVVVGAVEAISHAFISGADRALLYEAMTIDGLEDSYLTVSARLMSVGSLISGISIALGSFFAEYSWSILFVLSALIGAVQLACACTVDVDEDRLSLAKAGSSKLNSLLSSIRETLIPAITSVGLLILVFGLLDGIYCSFYSLNQLIFKQLNVQTSVIGLFFSISYVLNSLSYIVSERIAKKLGRRIALSTLIVSALVALVAAALIYSIPLIYTLIVFIACLLPEMIYVISEAFLQDRVCNKLRNTSLSLLSLMNSLASSLIFFLAGVLLDCVGTSGPLWLMAILALCSTFIYLTFISRLVDVTSCV